MKEETIYINPDYDFETEVISEFYYIMEKEEPKMIGTLIVFDYDNNTFGFDSPEAKSYHFKKISGKQYLITWE